MYRSPPRWNAWYHPTTWVVSSPSLLLYIGLLLNFKLPWVVVYQHADLIYVMSWGEVVEYDGHIFLQKSILLSFTMDAILLISIIIQTLTIFLDCVFFILGCAKLPMFNFGLSFTKTINRSHEQVVGLDVGLQARGEVVGDAFGEWSLPPRSITHQEQWWLAPWDNQTSLQTVAMYIET